MTIIQARGSFEKLDTLTSYVVYFDIPFLIFVVFCTLLQNNCYRRWFYKYDSCLDSCFNQILLMDTNLN